MDCLFCKIIEKEIPSTIVYEDEEILAFKDIHPMAPVHILVIPKKHIASIQDVKKEDLVIISKIYEVIQKLAEEFEIAQEGYRVITNCRENGGQEVNHLHFHLLGGAKLGTQMC